MPVSMLTDRCVFLSNRQRDSNQDWHSSGTMYQLAKKKKKKKIVQVRKI